MKWSFVISSPELTPSYINKSNHSEILMVKGKWKRCRSKSKSQTQVRQHHTRVMILLLNPVYEMERCLFLKTSRFPLSQNTILLLGIIVSSSSSFSIYIIVVQCPFIITIICLSSLFAEHSRLELIIPSLHFTSLVKW